MGWFHEGSHEHSSYERLQGNPHKAEISHELISAAAAYEASKAWEEHQAKNGKPDDHAKAKEIIAGFAGAFVDRMIETKGLDFIDREKAKRDAQRAAEHRLAQEY